MWSSGTDGLMRRVIYSTGRQQGSRTMENGSKKSAESLWILQPSDAPTVLVDVPARVKKQKNKVRKRHLQGSLCPVKHFLDSRTEAMCTHSLTLAFWTFFPHPRPWPDINTSQLVAPAPPGEERLSLFTSRPVEGL